ncbi:Mitochondrial tRNAs modification protein [Marasmius sp. AFHP31]|nr:Mitochondrial tRNAs modification protein [Marasmius sp. AFHP31]
MLLSSRLSQSARLRSLRHFTVLALESSADDTCAAIVNSNKRILSNVRIKQNDLHEKWGGIHPAVAILAHQRNMPIAIKRALEEAQMDVKDVDGIAFTRYVCPYTHTKTKTKPSTQRGPGIPGCLAVGCNSAKALAAALNKPLVGVHHMQAHALTPILTSPTSSPESSQLKFPFLTLLASGGHTLLLLSRSPTHFQILATTLDESVGRTIDKVARILQVPGWAEIGPGAALEVFCRGGGGDNMNLRIPTDFPSFPKPIPGKLAFSFSSLHSHLERYFSGEKEKGKEEKEVEEESRRAIAIAFQESAFGQLVDKIKLSLFCRTAGMEGVKHPVVSGGVASNSVLRDRLKTTLSKFSITPVFPPPDLCTDNAAMIAWASMYRFLGEGLDLGLTSATREDMDPLTIAPKAKWSIEDLRKGDGEGNESGDGLW